MYIRAFDYEMWSGDSIQIAVSDADMLQFIRVTIDLRLQFNNQTFQRCNSILKFCFAKRKTVGRRIHAQQTTEHNSKYTLANDHGPPLFDCFC